LDCPPSQLTGLTVDVLGAGGAARAVLYGLSMFGCDVTIFGRSLDKARRLADEHGARAAAWEDRAGRKGKVLINCTSVGLWPRVNESPMPQDSLDGCRLVFDLVYHPLQTQLLRQADQAGVQTLNGLDMFIRQAAMQFELWTSKAPDRGRAYRIVADEIRRYAGSSE
ncbi:MAG: hypothetical protein IIC01_01130, partial [Planctomycetes bacterium]|nr:hypothetical protein [Planctomycetota bacterium]